MNVAMHDRLTGGGARRIDWFQSAIPAIFVSICDGPMSLAGGQAASLLRAVGRREALRAWLRAEQDRGANFPRLANALSALSPKTNEAKQCLDAMPLAVPR